jgi:XisI protein
MESSPTALAQPNAVSIEACQQAIIDTLLESMPESLLPNDLQVMPIFDRQAHRYQLLCQGWGTGEKRIFHPIIHIEIIDGKVWIQQNQSDTDVGEVLCDRGIPKSQMVLGLYLPSLRQLNPTYASGD